MNWARRLKRGFGIEIEQCVRCGGRLAVIASIEEPELVERILGRNGRYAHCCQRRRAVQNIYPLRYRRLAVPG